MSVVSALQRSHMGMVNMLRQKASSYVKIEKPVDSPTNGIRRRQFTAMQVQELVDQMERVKPTLANQAAVLEQLIDAEPRMLTPLLRRISPVLADWLRLSREPPVCVPGWPILVQ